jgi:hypothetical protein
MTLTADRPPTGAAPGTTRTRALLACGAIAGPLFTVAWILEGATRANYHPLRHPVSSLELGDLGWTQQANFIVAGGLTLAFAVGLWRALRPLGGSTWGPLLVGAHGIGLLGAGIFVTDPVSGYPPGTPDHLVSYGSVHAALHDLFSVGTFVGLPIACLGVRPALRRLGPARLGDLLGGDRRGLRGWVRADQHGLQPGRATGGVRRAVPARHRHRRLELADPARRPPAARPAPTTDKQANLGAGCGPGLGARCRLGAGWPPPHRAATASCCTARSRWSWGTAA